MCGFSSKSKFIIRQHMVSRHGLELVQEKEHKCFMCHEVLKEKNKYKKHKAQHQK